MPSWQKYNRNRAPAPFKVGDLVYYRNYPVSHAGHNVTVKLFHRWKGTFRIDKFLTPVTVRLVDPTTSKLVTRAHMSLLKPDRPARISLSMGLIPRTVMGNQVLIAVRL